MKTNRRGDDAFYADLDEESGLYCVFGNQSGHAYGSYASLEEAKTTAKGLEEMFRETMMARKYRSREMAKNLFESASPAAKAGLKKSSRDYETVDGVEMCASINVVEDTLAALRELHEGDVKVAMQNRTVALGAQHHKHPGNYFGEEGDGEASLQIKKRASNSKLDENQVAMLTQYGIPFETVPNSYKLNPKYVENETLMKKVNAALNKIPDMPDDIWVEVPGKAIVNDESIAAVFRLNDKDTINNLLPLVTTLAVAATLKETSAASLKRAFARVSAALNGDLDVVDKSKKVKARVETLPQFARKKKPTYNNKE